MAPILKKNKRKNLLFIILLIHSVYSSPLETTNNSYANPFIIYYNPSLISRQTGAPIGASYYYNNLAKEYSLTTGFIETFQKSGFSLCYIKKNYEIFDKISTAFSTVYKKISFGASFHFIFSGKEPLFTLDAGGSYHFNEGFYAGLVIKNIFEVDTSFEYLSRELNICAGGELPWIKRMFYTINGMGKIYDFSEREFGYGGDVHIQQFFFKNPTVSIYSGGTILYNREQKAVWSAEAGGGSHIFLKNFIFGVLGGYEYVSTIENGRVSVSLYVNPLYKRSSPNLSCDIALSSSKFSPNGDGKDDVLIITKRGVFNTNDVKTKRWTLVIKKYQQTEEKTIRTFSGGDMPPSSTLWDGRDTNEKLVENGVYYIQLFIVDTLERVVLSSIKTVIVE